MTKETTTVALFDIDGTIFRTSLALEHLKKLLQYEVLENAIYVNQLQEVERKWENRQIDYDTYMDVAIEIYNNALDGLSFNDVDFAARKVIEQFGKKIYKVTKSRIKYHKENGHKVIFISGSPNFLVDKMAKLLDADESYSTVYEFKYNKFTGNVETPMWDSVSKSKKIDELVKQHNIDLSLSYAYGDTQGDYLMLSKVGNPIAINPNKKLLSKIVKSNFKDKITIFVERKNIIYTLDINTLVIDGHKLNEDS